MFETYATVVGTVITDLRRRTVPGGDEVISFRVAGNARRQDKVTGEWRDNGTLYLTVSCWGRLVHGVGAVVAKGTPVIAHGHLRTNEYTAKDGTPRSDLEMRAVSVGYDLGRGIVRFENDARRTAEQSEPAQHAEQPETAPVASADPDAESAALTSADAAVAEAAQQPVGV